ncbi:MAG: hypothetical protein GX574_11150 [Lentisphaerae bacterium]|nr:hypothetical protein [Lentisphaerota bacterium]
MTLSQTVPENIFEAAKIIAQVIRRKELKSLDIPGTTGLVKATTMSNSELQQPIAEGEAYGGFRHCN